MKSRFVYICSLVTALMLAPVAIGAPSTESLPATRELAIVVVEAARRQQGAITDFDRIDMAFQDLAKERKWPVKITAERFAANSPAHDTELRIFNRPVREDTPGDLTFHGWMTLTVDGTKHDFGMITFRYYRRAGEATEDSLEKVFMGAAKVAAAKIEPILFPQMDHPKS